MSKIEDKIKRFRTEQNCAAGRRILVVEGSDDVKAFQALLDRKNAGWARSWAVVDAGNKKQALEIAEREAEWLILVDRDEWSPDQLSVHQGKHQNICVLPRFCLESYLVDYNELWQALGAFQQEKIPNGKEGLAKQLQAKLSDWKSHAARWQVINPLWSSLRALGFKENILRTEDFPDQTELAATLAHWNRLIDDKKILADIEVAMQIINQQPEAVFLHHSLYAKSFFPQVVVRGLCKLLGQQRSEAELRKDFFTSIPLPGDLEPLWQRMGV